MRRRPTTFATVVAALAASLIVVAGTANAGSPVMAPPPAQSVGLEGMLSSLVSGDSPLITEVPHPQSFTPYGGEMSDDSGESTILDEFELMINPQAQAASRDLDFDGDVDVGTTVEIELVALELKSIDPVGVDALGEEWQVSLDTDGLPAFGGTSTSSIDELLLGVGVDPTNPEAQNALGTEVRVARPMNPMGTAGGPITIWGGHTRGGFGAGTSCANSMYIYEFGRVWLRQGSPAWPAPEFAPFDLFTGASNAVVVACNNDSWSVDAYAIGGSAFNMAPTDTVALIFEDGFLALTPSSEFVDDVGYRSFHFRTPSQGGYQPDNTWATVYPEFPQLMTPMPPFVVSDPYPEGSHGPFPLRLDLQASDYLKGSNEASACGASWGSLFEAHLFDSGEPGTMGAALYQFPSAQYTLGRIVNTESGFSLTTDGGGDGYTEGFAIDETGGQYMYRPGDLDCTYDVTITSGAEALLTFIQGQTTPEVPSVTPTLSTGDDTTDSGETDTGDEITSDDDSSVSEPVATTTDDPGEDPGDEGDSSWPIVALVAGLISLIGGTILRQRGRNDSTTESGSTTRGTTSGPAFATSATEGPCDRLRRLFNAAKADAEEKRKAAEDADGAADDAEAQADDARSKADDAKERADDAKSDREDAERDRDAPEPGDEETYIEDSDTGERITLTDLKNRRAEAGKAWEDYKSDPSPESAAQTEKDWEALDAEGARAKRRADWEADQAERAKALADAEAAEDKADTAHDELDEAAEAAEEAASEARAEAERLDTEADTAEERAAELKRKLDECLNLTSGTPTRWGGPVGLGEDSECGCYPEGNVERRVLATFDKTVKINWWVTVRPSSSARDEARRLAGELRWWRDVFGTGSSAINVAGAVKGLTSRTVKDAVDTAVSGASVVAGEELGIDIPTVLPQVPLVILEGAAATSAALIGAWGRWIEHNHVEWIAEFGFQVKDVKMTWVEIWKCENGVKSCEERVLEVEMSDVRNTGATHTETYHPREEWQSRVDGLGRTMARQAQTSSQEMVTFMGRFTTGSC